MKVKVLRDLVALIILIWATLNNADTELRGEEAVTQPHFHRVGDLYAPMVFHHLVMKLNRSEIDEESSKIFKSLTDAYQGYVGHGRATKSQAWRALQHLEAAQLEARETMILVFGFETLVRPKKLKVVVDDDNSTKLDETVDHIADNRARHRRQAMLAAAAFIDLGLGAYNLYEIQLIKSQMSADHEAVIRMSQLTEHLEKTLFSITEKLNREQYGEKYRSALATFHHFWRDLGDTFLGVIQGNAVPAMRSAWFKRVIEDTLARMVKKGNSDGCVIHPGIHSLLLFPAKGLRTEVGVEFYLPVPCAAAKKPLFKLDRTVRLAGRKADNSSTLYEIVTEERFVAVKDEEYVILSEGDLMTCEKIGTSFFCPLVHESIRSPDNYCIGNVWTRNVRRIRDNCNIFPSKAQPSFVRGVGFEYIFLTKVKVTMSCRNGSRNIWENGLDKIVLDLGCEIRLGSGEKITRLNDSTTVIRGRTEPGLGNLQVLEFYDEELDFFKEEESLFRNPVVLVTSHVITLIHLVLFFIAVTIFGGKWFVDFRAKRLRRKRRRQRLELEGLEMEDMNNPESK